MGSAPSGGFSNPKYCPQYFAAKNQSKTQNRDHAAADQKNNLGEGKNDLNILLGFLASVALAGEGDEEQLWLGEEGTEHGRAASRGWGDSRGS
jgi:hypothetical protein